MFHVLRSNTRHAQDTLAAFERSQGIVEFSLDGKILRANKIFLDLMGYEAREVVGQHHSLFVDRDEARSAAYQEFWAKLNRGQFVREQFRRIAKGGREVWIEASYNPILDAQGKPYKMIKIATDVTASKLAAAEQQAKIDALLKSLAVVELNLDGTLITANENFLNLMGYSLNELKGKHHSTMVEPSYAASAEYKAFWAKLNRGEFDQGQYKRIAKGNRVVWIEASYNPIFGMNGKVVKVIKYATDITKQALLLSGLNEVIRDNFVEIESAIDNARTRSSSAEHAASSASSNVQMVAAAAEELASSVKEIAGSMAKSRAASDATVTQTDQANEATSRLAKAAGDMSGIVDLIQSIASQINMLALNATIESARAGEAGKGFAVVANEVKHLAKQVSDATGKISQEIDGIQSVAGDVTRSLSSIADSIRNVREYVAVTASAVEEQSAVTREMSSNMQMASSSVDEISTNIGGIAAAISQVSGTVQKTKEASSVLVR